MADFIFALILITLVAVSALCSTIFGGLHSLNHYQLKRKAMLGDKNAKLVYPLHSTGYQLLLCVLTVNITVNAIIAVLLANKSGNIYSVIFSLILILFFGELLPMLYLRKRVISITAFLAPVLRKILGFMTPVVRSLARAIEKSTSVDNKLYSKEELLNMFDGQKLAPGSDIAPGELKMIKSVLQFGDKKIREVMTPRRMVQVVTKDDEVGPVLMDELHKSGYSRFPVVSEPKHYNFVGTLYLRDLVGESGTKKVKDLMSSDVRYVHEEESLDHALRAFLKTHHHLFVVVNSFEEFVGVLSIEDVLETAIGSEIVDEFDAHDDLRAVAKSLAEKEKALREKRELHLHPSKDSNHK
ncbi:DUF21 domain-containing protein [Candidatus Saccharibacteria bacterium]|nr:DUF21 domain-containing protein [Candidatus Saccharibacteria bacterium]